jgi:hypothetical protein
MALVDVETSAENLAAALDAISSAQLESYGILRQYRENAPVAPAAESEVERKLRIELGTATRLAVSSMEVPSPIFTIEIAGTDVVNPADAAVVNLLDELTNGLLTPGNGIVTWFGADITRASTPVIIHRNRKAKV